MHLIERYALACGAKINKPEVLNHFYPLPFSKYICVASSSSNDPKNYSFWEIVFGFCIEEFNKHDIKIIQIGDSADSKIPNHLDLRGKLNLRQTSFLLKNSLIFVGADGVYSHIASFYGNPSVSLYPFSFAECSKPYWGPSFPIAPDRPNSLPPFAYNEHPKSIDSIKPESIISGIFQSLKIQEPETLKTIYSGERCFEECLEIIPKEKTNIVNPKINIRIDKFFNEEVLFDILSRNACEVTTDRVFSLDHKAAKNISAVNYISDNFDTEFVNQLKKMAIKMNLLCLSKDTLSRERKKLFDFQVHYFNLIEQAESKKSEIKLKPKEVKIFTKKRVMCGDKFYETLYEYTGKEDDFFLDLEWFYCYQ